MTRSEGGRGLDFDSSRGLFLTVVASRIAVVTNHLPFRIGLFGQREIVRFDDGGGATAPAPLFTTTEFAVRKSALKAN